MIYDKGNWEMVAQMAGGFVDLLCGYVSYISNMILESFDLLYQAEPKET
jgi:hypothetical protein